MPSCPLTEEVPAVAPVDRPDQLAAPAPADPRPRLLARGDAPLVRCVDARDRVTLQALRADRLVEVDLLPGGRGIGLVETTGGLVDLAAHREQEAADDVALDELARLAPVH